MRFLKLRKLAAESGIPVSTLRDEIHAGRLKAIRARPSCSAPLLVRPADFEQWLEEHAAKRLYVPAPSAVATVARETSAVEGAPEPVVRRRRTRPNS